MVIFLRMRTHGGRNEERSAEVGSKHSAGVGCLPCPRIGGASYGPANELTSLQNGGTYYGAFGSETRTYNSMKQLTQIQSTPYSFVGGVSTTYNYAATQNINGGAIIDHEAPGERRFVAVKK